MLNSLREWGERRSTRVFALKIAQKRLEFEGVCTVTCNHQGRMELQACAACEKKLFRESFPGIGMRQAVSRESERVRRYSSDPAENNAPFVHCCFVGTLPLREKRSGY